MKAFLTLLFIPVVLLTSFGAAYAIGPNDVIGLNKPQLLTPQGLVDALMGPGVATNVATGASDLEALGTFTNGLVDGLGIDQGIILTSGTIDSAVGPNLFDATGNINNAPGDADLNALVAPLATADATVLEFDITTTKRVVSFRFIFASDEYNESVGTQFNDVFGLFLNGANIALVPGTANPVTITNLNGIVTPALFNNNSALDFGIPTPFGTQFDGFSNVITVNGFVNPGAPNHVKIAIADTGPGINADTNVDSAVFMAPVVFGSFVDVLPGAFGFSEIEAIAAAGVTGGCSPSSFCPDTPVDRGQMAAFIIRSVEGEPPSACTVQTFNDVPLSNPFCKHIERMAALGITGGCGGGNFCPNDPVTRAQMAIFIVRAPAPLLP